VTNFTKKSFSVGAPGTEQYRQNWERTFRARCGSRPKHNEQHVCSLPLGHEGIHYAEAPGMSFSWPNEPASCAPPREADFPAVMELRHAADRAWEKGRKEEADRLHSEAAELFRKLTEGSP